METSCCIVSCPVERPLCQRTERGLLAIASEKQALSPTPHKKLNPANTIGMSLEIHPSLFKPWDDPGWQLDCNPMKNLEPRESLLLGLPYIPRAGCLKQQKYIFSQIWRSEVQDQGSGWLGFQWGLSSWCVDGLLLTIYLHGLSLVHVRREWGCVRRTLVLWCAL